MGDLTAFSGSDRPGGSERLPIPEYPDEELVAFTDRLWRHLPPSAPVLDAGCGRGRNAFYLSRAGFQVHAIDKSSVALSIAAARNGQWGSWANFQAADLLRLPYADGSFAAAVCVHVLPYHRWEELCRGARELWRVLQPGGYLYFDLLSVEDAAFGGGSEVEPGTFLNLHGDLIHFSDRAEIDELLEGFHFERILHIEIASVLGNRCTWGVWAVKNLE